MIRITFLKNRSTAWKVDRQTLRHADSRRAHKLTQTQRHIENRRADKMIQPDTATCRQLKGDKLKRRQTQRHVDAVLISLFASFVGKGPLQFTVVRSAIYNTYRATWLMRPFQTSGRIWLQSRPEHKIILNKNIRGLPQSLQENSVIIGKLSQERFIF